MKKQILLFFFFILTFFAVIAWGAASNPDATKLFQQAEEAFKGKDLDKAAGLLTEALKKEPDNAVYRYIFAKILLNKSDFITAKEHMDVVAKSRPSQEKGEDYNKKLKDFKKKIKDLQKTFNDEGEKKFAVFLKNQSSKDKLKLAVTLYQAFRLNPPLRYKNYEELKSAGDTYESALKGKEGLKGPMLQLAFLFEISNKKNKAAELYMKALDYVQDPNEEYV
ncbi:hypothetical protein HYY75_07320, partial [bacterium]|nr:hypothetical protein [bacterium]